MAYRMGLPGWRIACRAGMPVEFRVHVHRDNESGTFWAESPDLDGLVVSGSTLEELEQEVLAASSVLLELQFGERQAKARAQMEYTLNVPCAA